QRVLVEEGPRAVVGREIDDIAEAKPEENALLDPDVHAPAGGRGRVRFGGANLAGAQAALQFEERLARRLARRGRPFAEQGSNSFGQCRHARASATTGRPNARRAERIRSCAAGPGGTSGRR